MIHKYKLAGFNIVLDVYSGGVHVVDDLTYDILDNIEPPFSEKCPEKVIDKLTKFYEKNDIESCYLDVKELYEEKMLFGEDEIENQTLDIPETFLRSMCLDMVFKDKDNTRKFMTLETAKKAMEFMIKKSGVIKELEVDFHGVSKVNIDTVMQIIKFVRELEKHADKKFRFTMTSKNKFLDDKVIDFINTEISSVVISENIEDDEEVISQYHKLLEKCKEKDYYIKGTFTKNNLDFADKVQYLYDAGVDRISMEPLFLQSNGKRALTEGDLPKIFKEYENLALKVIESEKTGKKLNFFHFIIDLEHGACALKRLKGCGGGSEYISVDVEGNIYPCRKFRKFPEYRMGNIFDETFDDELKNMFVSASVYNKPECRKCWAKFYCSGGCNADNYIYTRDIHDAYKLSCLLQKKRIECAIMIKAAEISESNNV